MAAAITSFELRRDEKGRLVLTTASGAEHVGVEPVRAFPLNEPERWIALLDSHGRELVTIDDLTKVPAAARQLVLGELADREFLPRIQRVVRVQNAKEPEIWDVITDRGPVQFLLGDSEEIRRLGPHRAILLDVHGVRYYIPDSQQLDQRSQRVLSQYL
jgi:hypothetical protein